MNRICLSFAEFKRIYINNAKGGYYPVWIDRVEYKEDRQVIQLDMIVHWRLADGKILFLEVEYFNRGELDEIVDYCRLCLGCLT